MSAKFANPSANLLKRSSPSNATAATVKTAVGTYERKGTRRNVNFGGTFNLKQIPPSLITSALPNKATVSFPKVWSFHSTLEVVNKKSKIKPRVCLHERRRRPDANSSRYFRHPPPHSANRIFVVNLHVPRYCTLFIPFVRGYIRMSWVWANPPAVNELHRILRLLGGITGGGGRSGWKGANGGGKVWLSGKH